MNASSRYTVALHVLTLLAHDGEEALTSEFIAGSVDTNPVVIRRVLAALRDAKLVTSQPGPGGGWLLLRSAKGITLRDVYRAVEADPLFGLHSGTPNPRCPVGGRIQALLLRRYEEARLALEKDLERTTIEDLCKGVRAGAVDRSGHSHKT
ncbi:MAG TPA: Rrf2 family transcriptional regulator [Polyangia bacterium]